MPYITAASTISHQPTFGNFGFSATIEPLGSQSDLCLPDFKPYVEGALLRRMGKLLRMSVASAKMSLEQAGIEQPDAIIVGTGLGCLQDTEKFLDNSLTLEGLIPPTAFIQSTHNTVAGQISLSLKNHGYNMTHTQNTVSFEHALTDGVLSLSEGLANVLVGSADEKIDILDDIAVNLGYAGLDLTSGVSFFVVTDLPTERALAKLVDTEASVFSDPDTGIVEFLQRNSIALTDIDLILMARKSTTEFLSKAMPQAKVAYYSQLCGIYATSSSFAFHYGVDYIQLAGSKRTRVLIVNNQGAANLGLTLLETIEA